MEKEITNNQLAENINSLTKNVNELTGTVNELAEAVGEFSNKVDERFNKVDERFNKIEAAMVTKDYLDEKLADLRGDLVVLIRKEDTKVKKLVDILLKRNIISEAEGKEIFTMEPFAQILL